MNIRRMTAEDLSAVYAIELESFSEPWSLESLTKELENHLAYYIVAEEQDEIIGYAGMWGILDEGEITNIAVKSKNRGAGIGSLILEALLNYAKEKALSRITLEVRAGNEKAKKLYHRHHFECIACRKNYYHKPTEDALIMQYIISS